MTLTFQPRPGAASLPAMVLAQARLELRMLLRNGEQLLLTIVIPLLVLGVFASVEVMDLGTRGERADFLTPGVLALAVISTAFTSLAIGTGFERRYGALKRLGASPLPRWGLLAAKTLAVLAVEALQVALICGLALTLGWSPRGSAPAVLALLLAGTAAFSALGLLMAGTLRAEATLAAANLVYLLLLVAGGIAVPLDRFPSGARAVLELLPAAALSEGLRDVLRDGAGLPWGALALLVAWAGVAGAAAAATFRWE
ncbi:MAG: ABC transporter permease [Actinomycetes bacterium]